MKTIWKFTLRNIRTKIEVPVGPFKPLHVAEQDGQVTLWAEVCDSLDPEVAEKKEIEFEVVATGQSVGSELMHVGTCQIGIFVWHVYWRPETELCPT